MIDVDRAAINDIILEVRDELMQAMSRWPPFNSAHEGYAIILEELEEIWEQVKTKQKNRDLPKMKAEAIQLAAMAVRFASEVCDEDRGRK